MPTHSYLGVGRILCLLLYGSGRDLMPTFGKAPIGGKVPLTLEK
jgi:hypothetical protein